MPQLTSYRRLEYQHYKNAEERAKGEMTMYGGGAYLEEDVKVCDVPLNRAARG